MVLYNSRVDCTRAKITTITSVAYWAIESAREKTDEAVGWPAGSRHVQAGPPLAGLPDLNMSKLDR